MRRALVLAALGVLAACASQLPTPAPAPAPLLERDPGPTASASADASKRLAARLDEARKLLAAADLIDRWISKDDALRLRAQGMDGELLEDALRGCVRDPAACAAAQIGEQLVALVDHLGDERHLPPLLQLGRTVLLGERSIERVLARRMAAALPPCAPPTTDEVAALRATLDDLAVVEHGARGLVARPPTARELDDAAYFLAAVRDNGVEIGTETGIVQSGATPSPAAIDERAELRTALEHARGVGDIAAAQRAAKAYLESLGYPGAIDASLEADQTWGGARFSNVMRELALLSEIADEPQVATDLYRRANPGGGACGTSVDYRRGKQVRGVIRSAERAGKCSAVIVERLLDWENEYDPPGTGPSWRRIDVDASYGPGRLADAGFELARLYRGALVFRNRDADESALARALAHAPGTLGAAALARLGAHGPEAWELRVRATEGLADVEQREAITPLVAQLDTADPALRARTLTALGALTRRYTTGPCRDDGTFGLGSIGTSWDRTVTPMVDTACEHKLDDAATARLARRVQPWLDDPELAVRTAAIEALGEMAATSMVRRLARRRAALARQGTECGDDDSRCGERRWELETIDRALESIRAATDRAG